MLSKYSTLRHMILNNAKWYRKILYTPREILYSKYSLSETMGVLCAVENTLRYSLFTLFYFFCARDRYNYLKAAPKE